MSEACEVRLVVAVAGLPGSGKSTLAKKLAEQLRLRYVSSGSIFRNIAKERGLTLEELSKLAEEDPNIDRYIDTKAYEEAMKGCVVVDAHIAGWILKDVADVKIFLQASLNARANRIAVRDGKSFEEALNEVKLREASESRRFKEFYGIDFSDLSVYDLIINTEVFNAEETLDIALKAVEFVLKRKLLKSKA
ncbi:MAG: hypothetical protein B7O98_02950 [Zestosphaera tikiterensis]|uniref:Cytidylate kinase n=1 Tax=Zestosphaera tikiterensis TaxID=1973259 RepID=A0A2R7Y7F4_9CREN|nr:MAG: hypothetical protein B7O98_02950 [Zestosphaera tikiterensis]